MAARVQLIDRLRAGPVASRHWPDVAGSAASLRVRIHQLRAAGHRIIAKPDRRPGDCHPGRSHVLYVLEEPTAAK